MLSFNAIGAVAVLWNVDSLLKWTSWNLNHNIFRKIYLSTLELNSFENFQPAECQCQLFKLLYSPSSVNWLNLFHTHAHARLPRIVSSRSSLLHAIKLTNVVELIPSLFLYLPIAKLPNGVRLSAKIEPWDWKSSIWRSFEGRNKEPTALRQHTSYW